MNLARKIETEIVDFDTIVNQRPNPSLYLIQFKANLNFPNKINSLFKNKWENYGSYETETQMLLEFNKICQRENVKNGSYIFRCVWPDGRIKTSQQTEIIQ